MAAKHPHSNLRRVYDFSVLSQWPPFIKDSYQRAPHTSGWPCQGYTCNVRAPHARSLQLPTPIFISQHLVALRSFLGLLADSLFVVPHPEASKALPKNEPKGSHRDISGLMDRGIFIWSKVLEGNPAMCRQQDLAAVFAAGGRGRLSTRGGSEIRWAHRLSRKQAFDKHNEEFQCKARNH